MFLPLSTFHPFMKGILKWFVNTADLPVYTSINIYLFMKGILKLFLKTADLPVNTSVNVMKGVLMLFLIIDMIEYKEEKKYSQEPSMQLES